MSASRRFPRSRFQPGIAAMYACTGASPSAFAICGLPPERRTTFSPPRTLIGLASLAPGLAFAPAFGGDLDLVADLRGLPARDVPLASGAFMMMAAPRRHRRAVARQSTDETRVENAAGKGASL